MVSRNDRYGLGFFLLEADRFVLPVTFDAAADLFKNLPFFALLFVDPELVVDADPVQNERDQTDGDEDLDKSEDVLTQKTHLPGSCPLPLLLT